MHFSHTYIPIVVISDVLEKELVREGEKLSDLLSIPLKDALGRELSVNYQNDIVNVQEILEMTIARKQLFKDSVELQKLTLQQVIHIRNYEKNALQVIQVVNFDQTEDDMKHSVTIKNPIFRYCATF